MAAIGALLVRTTTTFAFYRCEDAFVVVAV